MANKKNKRNFKRSGYDTKKVKTGSKDFLTTGDTKEGFNDIQWWNANPQLLKDASNLSYGNIAGNNVPFNVVDDKGNLTWKSEAVPGIMALNYVPIIGVSKDGNSPVNNASRLVYSWVRHANSGSRNYEQSDLFTYILAASNLLTAHAELVRLYGIAQVYSKTNRYVGKALIETLGYDFNDVVKNLASLRYGINALAVRINSFAIPKDMHVFARHIMLASRLFADATETKAQIYVFKPSQYFKWSNVDPQGNEGSSLEPVMAPTYNVVGQVTVDRALLFVTDLINKLAVYEDCGLMSGDILKAFGESGVYHINAIPEDYAIVPQYDQVMLSQIHNADVFEIQSAAAPDNDNLWVTQNKNNIIYNPTIKHPYGDQSSLDYSIGEMNKLLDSGMESPTAEFNMEATRLKGYAEYDKTLSLWKLSTIGTELITSIEIFNLENGTVLNSTSLKQFIPFNMDNLTSGLMGILRKSVFDWAPIQYFIDDIDGFGHVTPVGELFNYTIITKEYIDKVNNAALLSVLNVYSMAMSK